MRINDNEEGTVDMDMLEENLKVIQGCSCRNCLKKSMQWILCRGIIALLSPTYPAIKLSIDFQSPFVEPIPS